jgi:hypothetical protein
MLAAAAMLGLVLATSQAAVPQEVPVLKANLGGDCSADFMVRGGDGQPVYNAIIHVRVRYGFVSVKRSDLEIGTNADGKARIEGLPAKAKPLAYDVRKGDAKGAASQDVSQVCHAMIELSLK